MLSKMGFSKRYYDSVLGLFWALINPILRVAVYYIAFTYLIDRGGSTGIDNFALYLFSGLIVMSFFSEGANKSMKLLKRNRYLSENTQFEKLDLFVASANSATLGFVFNAAAFVLFALILGELPPSTIILLPIFAFNIYLLVLGMGLILAIIYIYFKDLDHLWNIIQLLLFWTSPIFFMGSLIAENFPFIPFLHPVYGIMENIRAVLLYGNMPDFFFLAYNYLYAFFFLFLGLKIFRKYEHKALEKII